MVTSTKCINLYEEKIKTHLDHKGIYDLLSEIALTINNDMLAENPTDGLLILKKGNNIWNYVKMELDKRGWKMMKQDGYYNLIEGLAKRDKDGKR